MVEAAAGTGKTTALIARMIAVLQSGRARLSSIVAVTFTEKAAGEMKLRLRTELEKALGSASGADVRERLLLALAELETARIATIHAFCADLLRERPIEAGVDPELEILAESQRDGLLERAFSEWLFERLTDPPEGLRRMLRRRVGPRAAPPRVQLLRGAQELVERRDHPSAWTRPPFPRDAEIERLLEQVRSLSTLSRLASRPHGDPLAEHMMGLERFVEAIDIRERSAARDYDALEAELIDLRRRKHEWKRRGRGMWFGPKLLRSDVLTRRDALAEELDRFTASAQADLAACLQRDLSPVVQRYEVLKQRTGRVDYLDLLILTRNLLCDDAGVRSALRRDVSHIFVDEFQDTDPLQAEILLMLACEGEPPSQGPLSDEAPPPVSGKLFLVGDPKQSIYRFRRADVGLYERLKKKLLDQGLELLKLSTSFRSTPSIQTVINRAFAPLMNGAAESQQVSYVPLSPARTERTAFPSVIALPVPRPYGKFGKVFKKQVESSTPDAVGAFVHWLLEESQWRIPDPATGQERPLETKDICLLFRSTKRYGKSVIAPYAQALEARGLSHVLMGGRTFHDREEVIALSTVLRALEYPNDTLHTYAALRGPFFGFTDAELWRYRAQGGPLHAFAVGPEALWDPAYRDVASALDIFRELHLRRNRRPIADTIHRFLDATRAHAGVANWPNGEQALANVLRVLELARAFEAEGGFSFRGFVDSLHERLERGGAIETSLVEESAQGIRVMTVHKAKGLEFPVVILCDPTLSRTPERPSRYLDPERRLWAAPLCGCSPSDLLLNEADVLAADGAEEVRLAYVAATRARDVLVVPCVGDEAEPGWVDPLHPALYPDPEARRASSAAPGCPDFGEDTVLERPAEAPPRDRSVRPGLHRVEGSDIVWWDPFTLKLGRVAAGGLRRTTLLVAAESGVEKEHTERHLSWVESRERIRERASTPSVRAVPITTVAQRTEGLVSSCRLEMTGVSRSERATGARFGTLVHEVLADIEWSAQPSAIRALAQHLGLRLGATDFEIQGAADAVQRALAHPLLRAAARSDDCRRECPIQFTDEEGTSVEGIIDLLYATAGGDYCIVDYKTDRTPEPTDAYRRQLELYARGVRAVTERGAETVLFYV